jgi:hypothetical protein
VRHEGGGGVRRLRVKVREACERIKLVKWLGVI